MAQTSTMQSRTSMEELKENSKPTPTASAFPQWNLSRGWERYLSERKSIICQVPGCGQRPGKNVMQWQRWKWLSEHMWAMHRVTGAEIPKLRRIK